MTTAAPRPGMLAHRGDPDELVVVIHGVPVGQGSKVKLSHGALVDANAARLRPWRATVSAAARDAMGVVFNGALPMFPRGVPVCVSVVFTFARPASHFGTGRNAGVLKDSAPAEYTGSPDIDKAQRSVLDAFTDAAVWQDDRQVARITAAKTYPGGRRDAMPTPGAVVRVWAVPR